MNSHFGSCAISRRKIEIEKKKGNEKMWNEWKGVGLTASGFLWLIIRWSVFRTMTTRDSEPQSCDELVIGIWLMSVWTVLNDLQCHLGKSLFESVTPSVLRPQKKKIWNASDATMARLPFFVVRNDHHSHGIYAGDKMKRRVWPCAHCLFTAVNGSRHTFIKIHDSFASACVWSVWNVSKWASAAPCHMCK